MQVSLSVRFLQIYQNRPAAGIAAPFLALPDGAVRTCHVADLPRVQAVFVVITICERVLIGFWLFYSQKNGIGQPNEADAFVIWKGIAIPAI
ncbi:hypothetical protein B5G12_12600 [Faecalibacterium sp. An58]|nr:hypothetical protein B5G12_12600 [Faecalibacterium sp. An58]